MYTLINADCLDAMRAMEANSVDAIVTDPPAGISFMGKEWDGSKGGRASWIAWLSEIMREALRIAKPGSYALVWAIPRTSHWTGTAMEDAGWEVHDRLAHIQGQGFPKHKSKLKPSIEDWWLCRKPAKGATMLNIDACRVQGPDAEWARESGRTKPPITEKTCYAQDKWTRDWIATPKKTAGGKQGRWPSHLILDTEAAAELDRQSGVLSTHGGSHANSGSMGFAKGGKGHDRIIEPSSGGASRFFTTLPIEADDLTPFKYQAKASKRDRNEGMEAKKSAKFGGGDGFAGRTQLADGSWVNTDKANRRDSQNIHPTVKPTALMRWLCRLITPPGGTILDPFCGSGSTGKGALMEGFDFIGIERDPAYHAIATKRLASAMKATA